MISENAMYDYVKAALDEYNAGDYQDEKDDPQHTTVMAGAIKDYLEDNLVISFGWVATNPGGTPDPTISFVASIVFSSFDLSDPGDLDGLEDKVEVAVASGTVVYPGGFSLTPLHLASLSLSLPSSSNPPTAFRDTIIAPIHSWIKTLVNTSPATGSHGVYTGAATMVAIS